MVDTGGMNRFQTSWEMAKRSWAVLRSDKTLAWFPVFSFLGSLVVVGAFAGLVAATGLDKDGTKDSLAPIGYVFIALAYLGLAFVQTYFLAALVAGADARLQGRHSTVSTALQVANSRLHRLLPWAIVTATVTMVLQAIEERFGVIGRIGAAWIVVAATVVAALSGIYRTVLYRFASTGQVPAEFADMDLQGAFRPRGNDGGTSGGFGGGFGGFSRN